MTEQREIKFRAWDKKEKRMCPVVYALFPYKYWGKKGFWIDAGYYRRPQDGGLLHLDTGLVGKRFELMQFTGLHDKNGKEIYEGDIIRTNNKRVFKAEIPDIFYKLADGCWTPENDFEIIGNIYNDGSSQKSNKQSEQGAQG